MKFKLNCSPHLTMQEITKQLFNQNFLSDIQFSVDGKIIYGHSFELMKRSVVFEKQLKDTWGEKKLIPINDCTYESFLEFIRFIYTDECQINDRNGIELLKLATKYQVIMLENRVINLLNSGGWCIQLFGHCVTENYEIARHRIEHLLSLNFNICTNNEEFLTLHPDAVNAVLEIEEVKNVTEIEIFNALAKWIVNYCKNHQMALEEGRAKFDQLIRKIRFPTMSNDEIGNCAEKYPAFLTESDYLSIAKQLIGRRDTGWISKKRREWECKYEWRKTHPATAFETKFSVSKDMILHGLWVGMEHYRKKLEIQITSKNTNTNENEKIQFTQSAPAEYWGRILICLGENIRLVPNCEYTISIKYLDLAGEYLNVRCRNKNADLFYNNPENSIQMLNASDNMLEMIFKSVPK